MFSSTLVEQLSVLWFQAPIVISSRMRDLALDAMSGKSTASADIGGMINEKMSAAVESAVAMNVAMVKHGMNAASSMATGKFPSVTSATNRVTEAALTPYVKRVRANARRMTK